jgi:hypothetical protein
VTGRLVCDSDRLRDHLDRSSQRAESVEQLRVVARDANAAVGCSLSWHVGVLVECDSTDEVAGPGKPDLKRVRPGLDLLAEDPERPRRRGIRSFAGRDGHRQEHAVAFDEQGELPVEKHLDPVAGTRSDRQRPCSRSERLGRCRADDPVAREAGPFLKGDDREGRLVAGFTVDAVRGQIAKIGEPLLQLPGRRGRWAQPWGRVLRQHDLWPGDLGPGYRLREVEVRKHARRRSPAVDSKQDGCDSGNR